MKKNNVFRTGLAMGKSFFLLLILNGQLSNAVAQGVLTPPGPPGPTMKTLSQIEPRTPISSLPYTISQPGSYYLTTNLTGVSGSNGISISSGNVTLDLNGFTILGVAGSLDGISVTKSYTNLTVRNGIITGWGGNGLNSYSGSPRNMLFEKLTFSSNGGHGLATEASSMVRDCLSLSNGIRGMLCNGGEISHSLARANANEGIYAINTTISDCVVESNSSYGLILEQGTAMGCKSQFNGTGVQIYASKLVNCQIESNSIMGVDVPTGPSEMRGCRIVGNNGTGINLQGSGVVADNYLASNALNALQVTGNGSQITGNNLYLNGNFGMYIGGNSNRIDNNNIVVSASGLPGIYVDTTHVNNVITRNCSWGGSPNYNISTGNDVGPIGTAASATSPWANISH